MLSDLYDCHFYHMVQEHFVKPKLYTSQLQVAYRGDTSPHPWRGAHTYPMLTLTCRVWQVATNGQPGSAFRAMPSTWSRQLALVVSLLAFAGCLHWMVPWQVALVRVGLG